MRKSQILCLLCISIFCFTWIAQGHIFQKNSDLDETKYTDIQPKEKLTAFYNQTEAQEKWHKCVSQIKSYDTSENSNTHHHEDDEYLTALEKYARVRINSIELKSAKINSELKALAYKKSVAQYLLTYTKYEHDSQRVEKQDVFYRLQQLLEHDNNLLMKQYDIDLRLYYSRAASSERIENSFLAATEISLRKQTLTQEHDALNILAEASNLLLTGMRTYLDHLLATENALSKMSDVLKKERVLIDLEKKVLFARNMRDRFDRLISNFAQDDNEKEFTSFFKSISRDTEMHSGILDGTISSFDDVRLALIKMEEEANDILRDKARKYMLSILDVAQGYSEASVHGITAEKTFSDARKSFCLFNKGQLSVQILKLDAKAEFLEKSAEITKTQEKRRIETQKKGAATVQERDFFKSFANHFSQSSGRSWADQATLRRLSSALEKFEKSENEYQSFLEEHNKLYASISNQIEQIAESEIPDLYFDKKQLRIGSTAEIISTYVCGLLDTNAIHDLLYRALEDKPLSNLNDPSAIQLMGADDILQKALQPKDTDMVEMRNKIFRIWENLIKQEKGL